jgi:hypothetical protein
VEDQLEAFELDVAVALKGRELDHQTTMNYTDYIKDHILIVAQCLGYKPKKSNKIIPKKDLTVNEALNMLGGSGVIYQKGEK